ncbi:MAG: hypothetical protein ABWJ99_03055 [Caldimicrobium sp.]
MIEFLIALVILMLVITGITTGFLYLFKGQKQVELHNQARQLLEDIASRIATLSLVDFQNLGLNLSSKLGSCQLNGTCDFENSCFTSGHFNATQCDIASKGFYCLYCLSGQRLEPKIGNSTCSSGYPLYVDYDFYNIKDPETQALIGLGACLRTRLIDPISNQTKEYRKIILNFRVYQ